MALEKCLEMFKSDPATPPYPLSWLKIFKSNYRTIHWCIMKENVKKQHRNKQQIQFAIHSQITP